VWKQHNVLNAYIVSPHDNEDEMSAKKVLMKFMNALLQTLSQNDWFTS
jgi:hypothetical protein